MIEATIDGWQIREVETVIEVPDVVGVGIMQA